jgi:hypothetical protein
MTSLSVTTLTAVAMLLMAVVLFLATRFRRKKNAPPGEPKTWDSAAVQKFFAEVAADEKLFGVKRPERAVDDARKSGQLREIEALLASSEYKALTEEQQEMRVKLLADDSVVRLLDDAKSLSKENERLIFELRARREKEAGEFVEAQRKRDADIARLREMERKAAAGGNGDKALLAEIEGLKRRMAMARYFGVKQDD